VPNYDPLTVEQAKGCCGDAAWRGRLCEYHKGFDDALDVVTSRANAPTAARLVAVYNLIDAHRSAAAPVSDDIIAFCRYAIEECTA